MTPDIRTHAQDTRAAILADPDDGLERLTAFVNRYASSDSLRDAVLILRANRAEDASQPNEGDTEQDTSEMLALVERIEQDHSTHQSSAEAEQRQRAFDNVREYYLRQKPPAEPVFIGKDLRKGYRGTGFHLRGVTLTLRPGEITGVVGQNAHGKTTLLRIVAGELRPESGILSYPSLTSGTSRGLWTAVKSQLAYLPQELPPWRGSLLDNLQFEASSRGLLGSTNEREVGFVIERLGLRDHIRKRWEELSGGYKLRFSLARVLVWKPKLLVMDEPLANLDVKAQVLLLQDLRDLATSRRYPFAALLSSQHLHELEAVSTSMVFLREGQMVYSGPVEGIGQDRPRNVYELRAGGADIEARLRRALDSMAPLGLRYDGVNHILTTTREFGSSDVLRRLLEAGVEVEYFRDISRSVKSFFQ